MASVDDIVSRLEGLIAEVEAAEEPMRRRVFELLDGVDALHRLALQRMGDLLGADRIDSLRRADPAVAWLLDAYGVGLDERARAEEAVSGVRPYVESHGGRLDVLEASEGVVRVRLSGACSGCTGSAITLRRGVEEALRDGLPGFVAMEVEEEEAEAHPPPGPTLLQIESGPPPRPG